MNLHTGTSGYSYKEWKGSFYPKDLPASKMLRFYGEQFGTVEINNSFYKLPTAATVKAWAAEVPANFQFVLKSPQRITHFQKLNNSRAALKEFIKVASVLKGRLGPLFFQLPPNFKVNAERLGGFLPLLPKGTRAAFEFRHPSWFCDEVYALLRKHKAALCYAEEDAEDGEPELKVPFIATTDWGYLRLRRAKYSPAALKKLMKHVRAQRWKDAYVFFKHEDEGTAPRFARQFDAL